MQIRKIYNDALNKAIQIKNPFKDKYKVKLEDEGLFLYLADEDPKFEECLEELTYNLEWTIEMLSEHVNKKIDEWNEYYNDDF